MAAALLPFPHLPEASGEYKTEWYMRHDTISPTAGCNTPLSASVFPIHGKVADETLLKNTP